MIPYNKEAVPQKKLAMYKDNSWKKNKKHNSVSFIVNPLQWRIDILK